MTLTTSNCPELFWLVIIYLIIGLFMVLLQTPIQDIINYIKHDEWKDK